MGAEGHGKGCDGCEEVWGSEDSDDDLIGDEDAADAEEGEADGRESCGDIVGVDSCEGGRR